MTELVAAVRPPRRIAIRAVETVMLLFFGAAMALPIVSGRIVLTRPHLLRPSLTRASPQRASSMF